MCQFPPNLLISSKSPSVILRILLGLILFASSQAVQYESFGLSDALIPYQSYLEKAIPYYPPTQGPVSISSKEYNLEPSSGNNLNGEIPHKKRITRIRWKNPKNRTRKRLITTSTTPTPLPQMMSIEDELWDQSWQHPYPVEQDQWPYLQGVQAWKVEENKRRDLNGGNWGQKIVSSIAKVHGKSSGQGHAKGGQVQTGSHSQQTYATPSDIYPYSSQQSHQSKAKAPANNYVNYNNYNPNTHKTPSSSYGGGYGQSQKTQSQAYGVSHQQPQSQVFTYQIQPHKEKAKGHHKEKEFLKPSDLNLAKTLIGTVLLKYGKIIFTIKIVLVAILFSFLSLSGIKFTPIVFPLALLPIGFILLILFIPIAIAFFPLIPLGLAGEVRRRHDANINDSDRIYTERLENMVNELMRFMPDFNKEY